MPFVDHMTWDDVDWLVGFGRPVVVKGILHPDDARLAVEHGAAAIQVSNHGGRQLDGAIASLDALPAVVEAVAGRVPVLVDGGIRRGSDVVIALALGAAAVGIGRPALWGLAVDGEAGVGRILDLLTAETELAMALAGAASTADSDPGPGGVGLAAPRVRVGHRDPNAALAGDLERSLVARIGMADDAHPRIGRQHPLQAGGGRIGPVGHDDHPRVQRVPDAHATAVVDADPGRPRGRVQERVQDRPVGDGIGPVEHALGLAVGAGDAPRVEVVPPDDDRRGQLPGAHHLVDPQPRLRPLAVAQPADAGRQALERDLLLGQAQPSVERRVLREELGQGRIGLQDVVRVARKRRPAERALPLAEERAG